MGDPTAVPRIIFWITMGIWGVLEVRTAARRAGSDTGEDRGTQAASLGATIAGLLAAWLIDAILPEVIPANEHGPFLLGGAVFVAAGVALRIWAIRALGRFFTCQVMTHSDQRVIAEGPYRFVRHPAYTALLISCLGVGIATAHPLSVVVVIVLPLVGLLRRIAVEEAALETSLGDDYVAFCRTRKRLIPGVW